jgi:Gram-negative bacterial TonB protein C-terminal
MFTVQLSPALRPPILLVTVQADGTVSATKVESGHALLAPAAQDAVIHWRFAPSSETSDTEIEVTFNLETQ